MALLRVRRSAVPNKVPLIGDLQLGEVAINTFDARVFSKRDDGTPAIFEILTEFTGLKLTGGTLTGLLTLSGAPTNALHAATKQYVDDNAGGGNPDAVDVVFDPTGTDTAVTDVQALGVELLKRSSVTQGSNIAASSNTTFTINLNDGVWRRVTFTSSCTLALTFPTSQVNSLMLEMVNAGAYTITWPTGIKWSGGIAPVLTSVGTDLVMITRDGNNNYYGALISQAVA